MDAYLPEGFAQIFNAATEQMTTSARIQAVLLAYERALEDPKFVCPSHLHAALEALRRV